MGVKENGSEGHLFIDVDMDGGTNVEMIALFCPQQDVTKQEIYSSANIIIY
jgi:hypothetical protein